MICITVNFNYSPLLIYSSKMIHRLLLLHVVLLETFSGILAYKQQQHMSYIGDDMNYDRKANRSCHEHRMRIFFILVGLLYLDKY